MASTQVHKFNWPPEKVLEIFERYEILLSLSPDPYGDSGKVQGFICFQKLAEDIEIIALGTLPENRRQNIMRDLFAYFVQNLCNGNSKVFLEVHEGNSAALSFYRATGFKVDGLRKNYYLDGSNAVTMSYQVKD
jgi:ribosomal protein S18 acetylase RimI-like enzyme